MVSKTTDLADLSNDEEVEDYLFEVHVENWGGNQAQISRIRLGQHSLFFKHVNYAGLSQDMIESDDKCRPDENACHFKLGFNVAKYGLVKS